MVVVVDVCGGGGCSYGTVVDVCGGGDCSYGVVVDVCGSGCSYGVVVDVAVMVVAMGWWQMWW